MCVTPEYASKMYGPALEQINNLASELMRMAVDDVQICNSVRSALIHAGSMVKFAHRLVTQNSILQVEDVQMLINNLQDLMRYHEQIHSMLMSDEERREHARKFSIDLAQAVGADLEMVETSDYLRVLIKRRKSDDGDENAALRRR